MRIGINVRLWLELCPKGAAGRTAKKGVFDGMNGLLAPCD